MGEATWLRIHVSNSGQRTPPLFLKTSISPRSYSIHITDLSRVWSEELDDYAITDRGNSEDHHFGRIDKSNFYDLLETIASALKQSEKNKHKILQGGSDELILQATMLLPEPLDPFNWNFHAKLLLPEETSRQLTLPLLASSYTRQSQVNDLVHNLEEKDRVISKLLDQLESINVDLTTVFPSIAGLRGSKRAIKRDQAAKHVPGLRIFRKDEWLSILKPLKAVPSTIDEVMGSLTASVDTSFSGVAERQDDLWWEHLDEVSESESFSKSIRVETSEDQSIKGEAIETEDEEDDFQRQVTPPHLKKSHRSGDGSGPDRSRKNSRPDSEPTNQLEDNETTDDEDLDAPRKPIKQEQFSQQHIDPAPILDSVPQNAPERQPSSKPRSKFTIGKFKRKPTSETPPEQAKFDPLASSRKASMPETTDSTNAAPVAPNSSRSRFKIGGKKNEGVQPRSGILSRTPDPQIIVDKEGKSQSIASRTKASAADESQSTATGRFESKEEVAPPKTKDPTPEQETANEVAERRREALKRQLESKAPAKKKRRL